MSDEDTGKLKDPEWLRKSLLSVQDVFKSELGLASLSISHAAEQGAVTEAHWLNMLRAYLPARYEVSSGFIIDSLGSRSQQIDIVIFDKHFTPTLLDQERHCYIPAEAVYAVFEVKPQFDKGYLKYAGAKAKSVRELHRTSVPISHAGGVYAPKPHFPIVAGIVATRSDWSDGLGKAFEKNLPAAADELLDCGCAVEHGAFDHFDGRLSVSPRDGALMNFLFRLLGKLQSMGSVPAIDWTAYATVLTAHEIS